MPTAARTAQMITDQLAERGPHAGSDQAAPQHQGGRFADFGGCDVTDTKFFDPSGTTFL